MLLSRRCTGRALRITAPSRRLVSSSSGSRTRSRKNGRRRPAARRQPPAQPAVTSNLAAPAATPPAAGGSGGGSGSSGWRPRLPWVLGGGLLYIVGTGAGFLYWQSLPSPETTACGCDAEEALVPEEVRRRAYNRGAAGYDGDVGWHESASLINRRRRQLLERATGDVLEVAGGTGRNLEFYPAGCRVTLTDCSADMVAVARQKMGAADGGQTASGIKANVVQCAVMDAGALEFPDGHFDTVVDTFGLCSYSRPAETLRELARVVKPNGGRLLLLEHGSSHWGWLTRLLTRHAPRHAQRWGCWWNRDILAVVAEAGLVVEECERYQAGTLYAVVARPPHQKQQPQRSPAAHGRPAC